MASVVLYAAIATSLAIVAAHFGLLPRGAWVADEYGIFAHFREDGLSYIWFRFWSWSPRPLSELAIAAYAWAVTLTGRPLIVPVLSIYWLALIAAAYPAFRGIRPDQVPFRLLGASAMLAFLLLGRQVFSMYYWPIGAVAYMPLAAAALFVLFTLAGGPTPGTPGSGATAIVLTAAAWSSEAGALFATIVTLFLAAHALAARENPSAWRALAIPLAAALPVLWMIATNGRSRMERPEGVDPEMYGLLLPSLRAATPAFVVELLVFDDGPLSLRNVSKGVLLKLACFVGMHLCWADGGPDARSKRKYLPIFALATIATSFAMLVGSFRQFGGPCCEQHAQARGNLAFVAVAALAIWMPPILRLAPRWRRISAPAILAAALIFAGKPRLGDLATAYRHYGEPDLARDMTWASAASPGTGMVLFFPAPDTVFKVYMPNGTFRAQDHWLAPGILAYFGKETVTVRIAIRHGEW